MPGVLSDEEEIDSEEERDIVKEIREEIQQQVKKEMKEELAVMRAHIVKNAEPENKNSDLDGLDPELKLAILKMRKLDRILLKKMKKEKRVKKDRILLQQRQVLINCTINRQTPVPLLPLGMRLSF